MNTRPVTDRSSQTVDITLLALDLNTCTRCVGSLTNIHQAIALLQETLAAIGISVSVSQILIKSEQQARQHQFIISPTIRLNGVDIMPEIIESHCDSCTDLCGCIEGITCRVWRYRGEEYTEAPVGLIVDAILGTIYHQDREVSIPTAYTGIPDNLQQFFNSKAEPASTCCSVRDQSTCCDVSEKAGCCGTETLTPATCGCQ